VQGARRDAGQLRDVLYGEHEGILGCHAA
jgi:hypothetical protein